MNKPTVKDPHPYHHVIIEKGGNGVTVCVYKGDGYGGYDHWYVDSNGFKKVDSISGEHFFQDYWQDFASTEVCRNVYEMLNTYIEKKNNVVELKSVNTIYCSDDIPF